MDNFFESLDLKSISENELRRMSPIQLAYLGDVIYEFYIRNVCYNIAPINVSIPIINIKYKDIFLNVSRETFLSNTLPI